MPDRPAQERGELISRPPIIVYSSDIERLRHFGQENGYGDSATAFHALLDKVADPPVQGEGIRRGAAEKLRAADDLLRRLDEWDVMQVTGDGPYWRSEIARVRTGLLDNLASEPEAD